MFLFDIFKRAPRHYPKPYVGMILHCRTWGPERAIVEVVAVSSTEKKIMYVFKSIDGRDINISARYETTWHWFYLECYKLPEIEQEIML
jgi:hypothetical protein|tara:strand:+ start:3558 stop:3824 length:267 start_codon:yes stop_codon:yes gene_type:complete